MKPQVKKIANYPKIGAKLEEHIPGTEWADRAYRGYPHVAR